MKAAYSGSKRLLGCLAAIPAHSRPESGLPPENRSMRLYGPDCECPDCGLYFRSTGAFDRHQTGPHSARRCLPQHEVEALGMVEDAHGFWGLPPRAIKAENIELKPDFHDFDFYLS